jgi:hypothetical protein
VAVLFVLQGEECSLVLDPDSPPDESKRKNEALASLYGLRIRNPISIDKKSFERQESIYRMPRYA